MFAPISIEVFRGSQKMFTSQNSGSKWLGRTRSSRSIQNLGKCLASCRDRLFFSALDDMLLLDIDSALVGRTHGRRGVPHTRVAGYFRFDEGAFGQSPKVTIESGVI